MKRMGKKEEGARCLRDSGSKDGSIVGALVASHRSS